MVDSATDNVQPMVETVTINDLTVTVTATLMPHQNPPFIAYEAVCGQSKPVKHAVSFHPNLNIVQTNVDQVHQKAVQQVATEAAAHETARLLLVRKFAGGQ
jgi:hypothetical protein